MAKAKPVERRRHKRLDIQQLDGTLISSVDAEVLNLSLTGVAVETSSPLRPGRHYTLRLGQESPELRLKVEVRWCRLVRTADRGGERAPVYQAGLHFSDILSDQAKKLLAFIEEHVIIEPEDRLVGRFETQGHEPIDLEELHAFRVRRLSLSGMLIETTFEPQVESLYDLEIGPPGDSTPVLGRIVTTQAVAEADPPRWEVGVEFIGLAKSARDAIEQHIEDHIE